MSCVSLHSEAILFICQEKQVKINFQVVWEDAAMKITATRPQHSSLVLTLADGKWGVVNWGLAGWEPHFFPCTEVYNNHAATLAAEG